MTLEALARFETRTKRSLSNARSFILFLASFVVFVLPDAALLLAAAFIAACKALISASASLRVLASFRLSLASPRPAPTRGRRVALVVLLLVATALVVGVATYVFTKRAERAKFEALALRTS